MVKAVFLCQEFFNNEVFSILINTKKDFIKIKKPLNEGIYEIDGETSDHYHKVFQRCVLLYSNFNCKYVGKPKRKVIEKLNKHVQSLNFEALNTVVEKMKVRTVKSNILVNILACENITRKSGEIDLWLSVESKDIIMNIVKWNFVNILNIDGPVIITDAMGKKNAEIIEMKTMNIFFNFAKNTFTQELAASDLQRDLSIKKIQKIVPAGKNWSFTEIVDKAKMNKCTYIVQQAQLVINLDSEFTHTKCNHCSTILDVIDLTTGIECWKCKFNHSLIDTKNVWFHCLCNVKELRKNTDFEAMIKEVDFIKLVNFAEKTKLSKLQICEKNLEYLKALNFHVMCNVFIGVQNKYNRTYTSVELKGIIPSKIETMFSKESSSSLDLFENNESSDSDNSKDESEYEEIQGTRKRKRKEM